MNCSTSIQKSTGQISKASEISWRTIILDIDPDEVYEICSTDITVLKQTLEKIRYDLFQ